jgi:hypothetical protein
MVADVVIMVAADIMEQPQSTFMTIMIIISRLIGIDTFHS